MKLELNIGLHINGQPMPANEPSNIMRNVALQFKPRMMLANIQTAASGEPTLCVSMLTEAKGLTTKVEELARQFGQDCIAAMFQDERDGQPAFGLLLGDNTAPYGGHFDSAYWLSPWAVGREENRVAIAA